MTQTIEGRITDRHGRPVADATLSIVRATAPVPDIAMMTDRRGRFYLDHLAPGRYRLRVSVGDGGQGRTVDFTVPRPGGRLDLQIDG